MVIVLAVVLLLGANRLPQLARSLGEAARELRRHEQTDSARNGEGSGELGRDDTVTLTKAELNALLAERATRALHENRQKEHPVD